MSNNNQETGAPNAPAFDSPQGNSPQKPSAKAHEESADSWPLEADRVAIHDPLVDALRILAGYYGRRTSFASLTAGLPVPPSGITPILFTRALESSSIFRNHPAGSKLLDLPYSKAWPMAYQPLYLRLAV